MKRKLLCTLAALLLLISVLCAPAAAEETENFVFDMAGILSADDVTALNDAAREVSQRYNCGVYIALFEDMGEYGFSNIEDFAEEIYKQWDLGFGTDRTGIVLTMSMSERDYDLCAHGDAAHYAFTDYGKGSLSDEFLDNFRQDDWAGGFADYVRECEYMLSRAENGDPVDVPGYTPYREPTFLEKMGHSAPIGVIIGVIIAFIYCASLKKKMKSAKIAREASRYISPQGVWMQDQQDMFTHTTVTRQHIERDSGSRSGGGGTSVNSGGFSHSSGKF